VTFYIVQNSLQDKTILPSLPKLLTDEYETPFPFHFLSVQLGKTECYFFEVDCSCHKSTFW
jgi:hypothetical protein